MEEKEKLLKNLPTETGVYIFKDKKGEVIYIGKALNIRKRVRAYFFPQKGFLFEKVVKTASETKEIESILVDSEFNALLLEAKLIKLYKPKYNIAWKDDKHFLYIKITKEEFPKVLTARREKGEAALSFGPFPQAKTTRFVLKVLRRIFPFCSQKRTTSRPCFYSHLGLCHPCPSYILTLKGRDYERAKQKYRSNIANIKRVLKGESLQVKTFLEKEMKKAASLKRFEEAASLRDQIEKLKYITACRIPIDEYFKDEALLEDLKKLELKDLLGLTNQISKFQVKHLSRIECYDVSNFQGKWPTASLVVFKEGEPEKGSYRRFRIRFDKRPNDVAMIKETLLRRFNHLEWPFPDLIVIDGGKPQVSAATQILKKRGLKIPVIGLAKEKEEIIIPINFSTPHPKASSVKKIERKIPSFKILRLNRDSPALHLLRRIRDESHRFAIKYHRLLYARSLKIQTVEI